MVKYENGMRDESWMTDAAVECDPVHWISIPSKPACHWEGAFNSNLSLRACLPCSRTVRKSFPGFTFAAMHVT